MMIYMWYTRKRRLHQTLLSVRMLKSSEVSKEWDFLQNGLQACRGLSWVRNVGDFLSANLKFSQKMKMQFSHKQSLIYPEFLYWWVLTFRIKFRGCFLTSASLDINAALVKRQYALSEFLTPVTVKILSVKHQNCKCTRNNLSGKRCSYLPKWVVLLHHRKMREKKAGLLEQPKALCHHLLCV